MLNKRIKYPYVKFIFDVVGVLASIAILLMMAFNVYINFETNGNSSFGINIVGANFILFSILLLIVVVCAIVSFIFKLLKKEH